MRAIPALRYKLAKGSSAATSNASSPKHTTLRPGCHPRLPPWELLGLRWSDLDLNLGTVASVKTVKRVNSRLLMDDTKTEDSDTRPIIQDHTTAPIEHRNRQVADCEVGELWTDHDLVFPPGWVLQMKPRSLTAAP